jgi:hypothetical protein
VLDRSGRSDKPAPSTFGARVTPALQRIYAEARLRFLDRQKSAYQFLAGGHSRTPKKVVFIFGCQRSGTTLMLDIFREDLRTATFPEVSALSQPIGGRLRLRSLPEIKAHVGALRAPIVVLKPIVESQNATRLLDSFPGSSAIWMYRRYESVAASDLELFGPKNGIRNLHLLLSNDPPNWRAEFVPPTTRQVLTRFYRADMPPHDAAALFWWARNALFFDVGLDTRSNVLLCSYEELVSGPDRAMKTVYGSIGVEWPKRQITRWIHTDARGRRGGVPITSEVRELCEELFERLVECSRRAAGIIREDQRDQPTESDQSGGGTGGGAPRAETP